MLTTKLKSLRRPVKPILLDHSYCSPVSNLDSEQQLYINSNQCSEKQYTMPFSSQNLLTIGSKSFKKLSVPGDGNCFFYSLSFSTHQNLSVAEHYRHVICSHILEKWDEWQDSVNLYHDFHTVTPNSYFDHMISSNGWATGCEVKAAAKLLGFNIKVWIKGNRYNPETNVLEPHFTEETWRADDPSANTVELLLENNHYVPLIFEENPPLIMSKWKLGKRKSANLDGTCSVKKPKPGPLYHDKEKELHSECRKLGIPYKPPSSNESSSEKRRRVDLIRKQIDRRKKALDGSVDTIPNPPEVSNDSHFNHAMDCIRAFELQQMSYQFNLCTVCKERRLEMKMFSESICWRCGREKNCIKMFSSENIMDPEEVPVPLLNLTLVEQQLISRISPCINVHLLKHGGIAAKGHCVTFPQEINEPCFLLPRLPQEINIIKVLKKGKNDTSKAFRVRRHLVENALVWLKSNNPAFADITICKDRLMSLPVDGELSSIHTIETESGPVVQDKGPAPEQIDPGDVEGETVSGILLPDPNRNIEQNVQNIVKEVSDQKNDLKRKKEPVIIPWPTRDNNPVSEFTTQYFFTLAFPCLFPYGKGDFHINRPRTCSSMSDWAEHLLWYQDGRFAHHQLFKFIAHNMLMRKKALETSNYVVRQQLGDPHISISELKEKMSSGDDSIAKKILYFGAKLRGTTQYWAEKAKELRSLIHFQINQGNGLPSLFSTGSCAEYHFKPLHRLLKMYTTAINGSEIDLDNRNNLFTVLQQNTHIVGHYFDLRTQAYFHKVMQQVFGVDAYWYRQEFAKSRGMIHWHGLCWRSDMEPHRLLHDAIEQGLSGTECANSLSEWAASVFGMTALHPAGKDEMGLPRKDLWPPPEGSAPAPPEEDNPLLKLLMDVGESQESLLVDHLLLTNRINIHRCSDYCLRYPKYRSGGEKSCRMEFGTEKKPGKPLRENPAIILDKNGCMRLEMSRDHPMLVQHSRYHTQAWRANGDISIILSKNGPENPSVDEIISTERYVTGYACKGNESTDAAAEFFNDIVNMADESSGSSAHSLCTKLLMNTVKRDVSAVEASYELSSLPLYRSSHLFQYVSLSGSRVLERKGSTVTKSTPLDKYLGRDEKITTSWYNFICTSGRVPVVSGGSVRATWPLTEDYSRTMLLLHWPNWRKIADIKDVKESWVSKFSEFLSNDLCPSFVKADVERAKRKIPDVSSDSSDLEDGEDMDEQPEWMELVKPNDLYDDIPPDFDYDDGEPDFDWGATVHDYPSDMGLKWLDKVNEEALDVMSDELQIPHIELGQMNVEQQFAFNIVMKTLEDYKNQTESYKPLRLIVAGTAGSGKSYLIKCLVKAVRLFFSSNSSVQVLCPTGNSAHIIDGVTLHSFFKIPHRKSQEMTFPDGNSGHALQKKCEGLEVLLVDERSLIGSNTLGWMEFMCRCGIKNGSSSSESWGGIPVVVFFGDDVQLPPVCDSPVYKCVSKTQAALHGHLVWKEFTDAVVLKHIIRQGNDQAELRNVLLAMREYKTTPEQAHWLQKFQWNNLRATFGNELLSRINQRGLFVFPTHAEEWNHNKNKLLELNQDFPIAKLEAVAQGPHSKSSTSNTAGGLLQTLYLCRGAKVMLTVNLNVKLGLFNGSVGRVVDIVYLNNRRPKDTLPDVVMVDFSCWTGPAFFGTESKIVPIVPVERKIDCVCGRCKRKQIPLRLGWGTTIHRCQGMTIGSGEASRYIVIHPGTRQFESKNPGALYVALSRAKHAGNETTDPDFAWHPSVLVNEDRLCHVVSTATKKARDEEIKRIWNMSEATKATYNQLCTSEIFQHFLQILNNNTDE